MGRVQTNLESNWVPAALVGLGVLLATATLVEVIVWWLEGRVFTSTFAASVATSLLCDLVLVIGAVWLEQDAVGEERYLHVAGGVLAGVAFLVIFLGIVALAFFDSLLNQFGVVRWAVSLGATGGFLIGFLNARTIDAAVAAERAVVRADEAERRQELLEYLNALLRHEVLNTATVIQGNAALVEEAAGDESFVRDRIGIVRRQTDELNGVIDDVQLLLEATEERGDFEPVDLSSIARDELEKLHDRYEPIETEARLPDGLDVFADDLIRRLFSNLFQNAIEHNESALPRVSVTATTSDDSVTILIEDNGSGFPDDELDDMFEPLENMNANHGLGLAIVDRLAVRYGGSVELEETGPDGSSIRLTLPLYDGTDTTTEADREHSSLRVLDSRAAER